MRILALFLAVVIACGTVLASQTLYEHYYSRAFDHEFKTLCSVEGERAWVMNQDKTDYIVTFDTGYAPPKVHAKIFFQTEINDVPDGRSWPGDVRWHYQVNFSSPNGEKTFQATPFIGWATGGFFRSTELGPIEIEPACCNSEGELDQANTYAGNYIANIDLLDHVNQLQHVATLNICIPPLYWHPTCPVPCDSDKIQSPAGALDIYDASKGIRGCTCTSRFGGSYDAECPSTFITEGSVQTSVSCTNNMIPFEDEPLYGPCANNNRDNTQATEATPTPTATPHVYSTPTPYQTPIAHHTPSGGMECYEDSDCPGLELCENGVCVSPDSACSSGFILLGGLLGFVLLAAFARKG